MTFLFTDIEGSTRLLQEIGDDYRGVLEEHNTLVGSAIADAGGVTVRTEGDSFFAVFDLALDAIAAAVAAQKALSSHHFQSDIELKVRMGLHTGIGARGGDDYVGIDVHRAARIASAGHGGQILLSAATIGLAEQSLPPGVVAYDLGDHQLKDLQTPERLYRLRIDGIADNTARPVAVETGRHNLPTPLSSFVGRTSEMKDAEALLRASRLLTLTGPGGTGKTRLALELARHLLAEFAGGAYFVALAGISDVDEVTDKILEALPDHVVDATASSETHLIDYVSRRTVLLVLDNFEHVIDAAPIAATLLQASPETKIIATSRIPLRVAGEQEMPIPPLPTPDLSGDISVVGLTDVDSVALFVTRATSVRPAFELNRETGPVVAQLVSRLDGLPLAIELAASRVRTLSPQVILDNLSYVMAGEGDRDLPLRQRTIHNTILWSYELLPEEGRALLRTMSVFAGGLGFEELALIAGPELGDGLLDALETLVEHSLATRLTAEGSDRFRLLEVVRQFGEQELTSHQSLETMRERHAHVYADLVAEAASHLTGPDRTNWLDKLFIEHDNIRQAQKWAIENGQIDMAYATASSLWRFYHMRGLLFSARELLEDLLRIEGATTVARAKALEAAGGVAYWSGDMKEARRFYTEALALLRQLGEPGPIAYGLYNLAFARNYEGDSERAQLLLEEAHSMFVDLNDKAGMAAATWGMGDSLAASGDLVEARACFEQSISAFEQLDDPFGLGWALYTQGEILIRLGEHESARQHLERGMALFDASDLSAVVMFLAAFASLALAQGDHERGVRLAGAMTGLRDETGTDLVRVGISTASDLDPAGLGLDRGEFAKTYEEARRMSAVAAVAYALDASDGVSH